MALALAVLVLGGAMGLWLLSADARREIDGLATANADSTLWTLAQAEVEFLKFHNALTQAEIDAAAALPEVRRRFDVLFARIEVLRRSAGLSGVNEVAATAETLAEVQAFLDATVPLIDGSDAELAAALGALRTEAEAIGASLRALSLAGVSVFSQESEQRRERVGAAMRDLALLVAILFAALLAATAILFELFGTSRRRAQEAELKDSRLRAMVGTSLDAILVVGRSGQILDFNGAAERIFGYSPREAIGKPMAELIVPDHLREAHLAGMKRHIETGEKRVIDKGLVSLEARDKSGRVFPVELSISTANSNDGEIFVSYIRDISDRVAAERALVDARDRAVAGEKAKAEMLAVMSHEMRTPLNGIVGGLDLLRDTPLSDDQRRYANAMKTSGDLLLRHVNSVLEISSADAGKTTLKTTDFDVAALVQEIAESQGPQASVRGNTIEVRSLGAAPGRRAGDEARLRQVLLNLVGNAVKFTLNGQIMIEVETAPGSDDIDFRIIDTGQGIAEADRHRIFEDFVTLDPSFRREVEGTGLGLGLVRRMVAVMGGEVGVESTVGEGSVFWVRLSLPRAEAPTDNGAPPAHAASEDTKAAEQLSALLIEDNAINRLVASAILAKLGISADEAEDGVAGVEMAEAKPYDVIFMDISMPRMDGLEATARILEGDGPNRGTPIYALTAHAGPQDISRFKAAGMVDVVVKPLTHDQMAPIAEALRGPTPARDLRDDPRPPPAGSELADVLGEEEAARVVAAGLVELRTSLREVRALADNWPASRSEIAPIAHKMSGLAGVVGLGDVQSACRALEGLAETVQTDEVQDYIKTVSELVEMAS